jgi:hypothetical protein
MVIVWYTNLPHEPIPHARPRARTHTVPHTPDVHTDTPGRPTEMPATCKVQVMGSLLVSVLLLGFKLNSLKEIVQTIQRAKELKVNVALQQRQLEGEELALWDANAAYDTRHRADRTLAIESAQGPSCNAAESELVAEGLGMFAVFETSSTLAAMMKHVATIDQAETKHDEASGHLLGRSEAVIRGATPLQLAAYCLNFDSRYVLSTLNADVDLRNETIEIRSAHHTIGFYRGKITGASDRTFLFSAIAKKVADDPVTYVVVVMPISKHAKITAKDEAKAVRAENRRTFRFTEEAPGLTRVEYACSLDMKGFIPQWLTNKVIIPTQLDGLRIMQVMRLIIL